MKPEEPRRDFKRSRIAVSVGGELYPLVALSVNADGGLIVDLAGCAPVEHFRYGVLDVPPGTDPAQAPLRQDESSWSVRVAPKLHYHRSGLIGLSSTRRLKRHGIQATPPCEIGPNHKHCFSFVARHPTAWAPGHHRKTDLVFEAAASPTTITIAGFIGPTKNLRQESQPENPWAIMAVQDDGSIVPTVVVRRHGSEPRYYVWLELYADRPFGDSFEPGLILYAIDPYVAADPATPTPMVAVWSVPADEVKAANG
jgi:hypothetical protein